MHKSRLGTLIIDCEEGDLDAHAQFWSAALGGTVADATQQVNPQFIRLQNRAEEPNILLQKVEHPSRIHIDIETDDIEAEVERLLALGAVVVEQMARWVVLQAPSGHRFCVIGPTRPDFETAATVWE